MALEQFDLDGQVAIVTGAGKGVDLRASESARGDRRNVVATARTERWYPPRRVECTMATAEPGQMVAARFAGEGVRDGVPVITMEHINRLTAAAAPDWEYPPDNQVGVHRVVIATSPTRCSTPPTRAASPPRRGVVNAIDWICRAPKGLIAVEDIRPAAVIRGLMWRRRPDHRVAFA